MPLCHHLIEGMKVGSIPITNCEKLFFPNLNSNMVLNYSNMNQLNDQIIRALDMKEDEIIYNQNKRQKAKHNFFYQAFLKVADL